ncbi:hypothetical protein KFL_003380020 [Klebsormidium nitens]|uniref:Uncharacterized protein n=1 Tax=Klebsormidium nitens TaxID=105231 RepID=A0A1Y1IER5_KLENI|nr:hypothetical protein KFL_003380020 [Klebsormidium nitens]|eukprot:GAQ87197.1 hypothetical protein KFL_003380020 [Klebsormidium nitens]
MAGEEFQVWNAGREFSMGGELQGPEAAGIIDPFYECMDCPMFVDFTQPDRISEEDLQTWFEMYIDREVGKPRSYPLFRDPIMDLALCELEVERLLKGAPPSGLRPFQINQTPPRQRATSKAIATPPRQRINPTASSSPPRHGSPSGSPNSVLCAQPLRRSKSSKGSAWSQPSKASESYRRPAFGPADVSRTSKWGLVTSLSKSADLGSPRTKRAPEPARVSEPKLAFKVRLASKPELASELSQASELGACPKRYMLPTAASIRKQSPKASRPVKPSADGLEGDPSGRRPKWQLPSPVVRRTTPRHSVAAKSRAESSCEWSAQAPGLSNHSGKTPESQSIIKHVAKVMTGQGCELPGTVKGQDLPPPDLQKRPGQPARPRVVLPEHVTYASRSAYDLEKLAEERKARLRVELNRRAGEGATWQRQPAGLGVLPGGGSSRFDEQAQWVLAL